MSPTGTVHRRHAGLRRVALIAIAAAAAILIAPRAAHAGAYNVQECTPSSPGAPDAVFFQDNPGSNPYPGFADCGSWQGQPTGGLHLYNRISLGTYAYGAWSFYPPPGTYINTLTFRYFLESEGRHVSYITMGNAGGAVANWLYESAGWTTWTQSTPFNATYLTAILYCPGTQGGCAYNANAHTAMGNFFFKIDDTASPTVALSGRLVEQNPVRGTERLTISAADQGGGVSGAIVKVNDVPVASPGGSCVGPVGGGSAPSFRPCAASATMSVALNTEDPPFREGANTVEVCARDYANASGSTPNQTCAKATVNVDNSCTRSVTPSEGSNLTAELETARGRSGSSLRARSNEDVAVTGSVSGPAGPIGGALVCVYERVALDGETRSVVETAYTRPNGTFRVSVDAGPSRIFDVAYRANNNQLEREQLRVDSTVVPRLVVADRTLRGGASARFRGVIPAPFAADRAIALQARAGKKWRTFKQLRTDERGRFKARYRFTRTTGRVRYRFRALVKRQGGYPYERGRSKQARVLVRG